MPETRWVKGKLCGYLDLEEGKNNFTRKYFELDKESDLLNIYLDHPKHLPKLACEPIEKIDLNFISKVSDARKTRPKAGFCFSITIAGDQAYLLAESEDEMSTWINNLNEACRIIVPKTTSPLKTVAPPNARNIVAGGVIVNSADDVSAPESKPAASSLFSIKSGFATKQGAVRKNWKKRYFVLDEHGLSYFKGEMEREPIKTIPRNTILSARSVDREHHPHREYMYELETYDRTFNIQCETEKDCKKWVSEINALIGKKTEEHTEILSEQYMQPKSMPQPAINLQRVAQRPPSQEEIEPNSKAVWV